MVGQDEGRGQGGRGGPDGRAHLSMGGGKRDACMMCGALSQEILIVDMYVHTG